MLTFFGWILFLLLLLFIALLCYYLLAREKIAAKIAPEAMPSLKPQPIPLKEHDFFMRLAIWLFYTRRWELLDNWHFVLEDGTEVILHKGFDFDGASIPRPLWFFLSPVGLLLIPGLIHDYGYRFNQLWTKDAAGQIVPFMANAQRAEWDELFRRISDQINGMALIDYLAYLAVKWFGKGAWEKHRRENQSPPVPL